MKFPSRPAYSTLFAALFATGAGSLVEAAAVFSSPEIISDTRFVINENDSARDGIHDSQWSQGNTEIVIAQGPSAGNKREVKVITAGQHISAHDLPDINMIVSEAMSGAFAGVGSMRMAKSVKNAPYSAEVISEKVQTLSDGNQISRKTSTLAYRDSAGRTRQEIRDSGGEVRTIHIHDAVDGSRYVVSPSKKTATKIALDRDLAKRIEVAKERARTMTKDGKSQVVERGNPGEEIIVKRFEVLSGDGKKEQREEVKVNVVRRGGGPGQVGDTGPAGAHAFHFKNDDSIGVALGESMRQGPIGMSFQDLKWSAKSTTTQLGTKDFDGIRAEGKSVSYTIPAGEIGNKNPIVVSTETWTSADLQVVVYSRHSDPRVGDSIYRLANVKRSEQPATLFSVPEGYSIKDIPELAMHSKLR